MSGLKISYVCSAATSRFRAPNFTTREKETLLGIVSQYRDIVHKKESDTGTIMEKAASWQKIAVEFNEIFPARPRGPRQLRKCYENHKKRLRKIGALLATVKAEADATCDTPLEAACETSLNGSHSQTSAEDSLSLSGSVGYVDDEDNAQTDVEQAASAWEPQEGLPVEWTTALDHRMLSPPTVTEGIQTVPHMSNIAVEEYTGPQPDHPADETAPRNYEGTPSDDVASAKCAYLRQKTRALEEEHGTRMSILQHEEEYARLQVEIARVELARLMQQFQQRTHLRHT